MYFHCPPLALPEAGLFFSRGIKLQMPTAVNKMSPQADIPHGTTPVAAAEGLLSAPLLVVATTLK